MKRAFSLSLKSVAAVVLACGGLAFFSAAMGNPTWFWWLPGAIFVAGVYHIAMRLIFFQTALHRFFRRWLANDYSVVMHGFWWIQDEVAALSDDANKTADRLREYDRLHSERTGLSYRAMNLMFRKSGDPVLLADLDRKTLRYNPRAQTIFGDLGEQCELAQFEKEEHNDRFMRYLLLTALRHKVTQTGETDFNPPGMKDIWRIQFTMEPLKDASEKVRLILIFLRSAIRN